MTSLTTPGKVDGRKFSHLRRQRPATAKETAEQRLAEQAARATSLYGALLPDVEYLRYKFPVSREGALIRVDGILRTEDQVREIAARERRLEKPDPEMMGVLPKAPRAGTALRETARLQGPMPNAGDGGETAATRCRPSPILSAALNVATTIVAPGAQDLMPGVCGCGRPKRTCGRCWFKRGLEGPIVKRAVGRPLPRVCEQCGGPRSYWAKSLCRNCYVPKGRKPDPPPPRADAPDKFIALAAEIAAVRAELAAYKATVRAAVDDLVEHLGMRGDR